MTVSQNAIHKTALYITGILTLIFMWTFTLGLDTNMEFKNPETKKINYIFLTFGLPISFIWTSIVLWRLIEATFQTKLIISVFLIVFSAWTSFKYFGELFAFSSKQWQTNKVIINAYENKNFYQLERKKSDYFLFHKPYKKRVAKATSFLGLFWKIKKIESEEDL